MSCPVRSATFQYMSRSTSSSSSPWRSHASGSDNGLKVPSPVNLASTRVFVLRWTPREPSPAQTTPPYEPTDIACQPDTGSR